MVLVLLTSQTTTILQPQPTTNFINNPTNPIKHQLNLSKTLNPNSIKYSTCNHFHKLSSSTSTSYGVVENDSDTLYRRLSPVGDWSVSIVPILNHWIKEGRSVNKVQLQRIIRELRRYKRYKHSLEVHFCTLRCMILCCNYFYVI